MAISTQSVTRCAPIAWAELECEQVELLKQLAAAIDVDLVEHKGLLGRVSALLIIPDSRDRTCQAGDREGVLAQIDQTHCEVPVLTLGPRGAFRLPADAEAVAISMYQACQRRWVQVLHGEHPMIVVAGWAGGVGTSSLAHAIARQVNAVLVDASGPSGVTYGEPSRTAGVGREKAGTLRKRGTFGSGFSPVQALSYLVSRRATLNQPEYGQQALDSSMPAQARPSSGLRHTKHLDQRAGHSHAVKPNSTRSALTWADLEPDDIVPGDVLFRLLPRVRRMPILAGNVQGGAWSDDPRVAVACRELRAVAPVIVDAGRWNTAAARVATRASALVLTGRAGRGEEAQVSAIRLAASLRHTPLPVVPVVVASLGAGGALLLKHAVSLALAEQSENLGGLCVSKPLHFVHAARPSANRTAAKKVLKTLGYVRMDAKLSARGGWTSLKDTPCAP